MESIHFIKAHGLGNDFILTEAPDEVLKDLPALSKRLCDRRTGIGADGLVLVRPSQKADVRMVIYNSDGSQAQMCGNAIRCFARYVYGRGIVKGPAMRIETLAGIMGAECGEDGEQSVRICMGAPTFLSEGLQRVELPEGTFGYYPILMGVPHAVVPVSDPTDRALMAAGAAMEWAKPFPAGTNVDFVKALDRHTLLMRVWERGCGETLCCGTGATASALCMARAGELELPARVELTLGSLFIEEREGMAYMRGPTAFVFEGDIEV